jgi:hypothetical protein
MNADPWRKYAIRLSVKKVEMLFMPREEIDAAVMRGEISQEDYQKYWENVKADRLFEFAIHVYHIPPVVRKYGERYEPGAYALRCGGANQKRNPLNVFILKD